MSGAAALALAFCVPAGAAFAANPEAMIYAFKAGTDGAFPGNWLTLDKAGHLWGTTEWANGSYNCGPAPTDPCGSLFRLTPHGTKPAKLATAYQFEGPAQGPAPAGLLLGADGSFYGVAQSGAAGSVFRMQHKGSAWVLTTLYNFTGQADGGMPVPGLAQDSAGNLYGVTKQGGAPGYGVAFELKRPAKGKTTWTETVLHSFTGGADGATPSGPLVADGAGNFYGPASGGGIGTCPNLCGVVYELTPSGKTWNFSVAYSFAGYWGTATDGAMPAGRMVFDAQGNLYGVTTGGGNTLCGIGCGTVFEMTPGAGGWTESTLYAFSGGADGRYPQGGLIMSSTGALWGVATWGGIFGVCITGDGADSGCGTLFALSKPNGSGSTYTIWNIYDFQSGTGDGAFPYGQLVETPSGILYGVTEGGANGYGTIYQFNPADIGN